MHEERHEKMHEEMHNKMHEEGHEKMHEERHEKMHEERHEKMLEENKREKWNFLVQLLNQYFNTKGFYRLLVGKGETQPIGDINITASC